jgi:hypothetical protein
MHQPLPTIQRSASVTLLQYFITQLDGRAMVQAVRRRPPTAEARV